MEKRIKRLTLWWALSVMAGIVGIGYESYRISQIRAINQAVLAGHQIDDDRYVYTAKFAAAYQQGQNHDFKHAVQSYGQLLDASPSTLQQARIHYNIGNNLLLSAMDRRVNDDGSLIDEALYDLTQARVAYEQSLRLDPQSAATRFNLSLLLAILPQHLKHPPREQAGMELSNLPVGLP